MGRVLVLLVVALFCGGCGESAPVDTSTKPPADAGACGSDMDCVLCCNAANDEANEIAVGFVIGACACEDGEAPCASACAEAGHAICAEPSAAPSDACIACLNGELDNPASACVHAANTRCDGDEACAPLLVCLRGCP